MAPGAGKATGFVVARCRWSGAVLTCLILVLAGCSGIGAEPPQPPVDRTDPRSAGAATLLRELRQGLRDHDRTAVLALAAPDRLSRDAVAAIYRNAEHLRLSLLDLRYVGEDRGGPGARVTRAYGGRAWSADVSVAWRIPGYDSGSTRLDTRFAFVATPEGVRLASVGGGGDRGALWLDGPLRVARSPSTLVLVADGPAARYERLAEQAVSDVRQVLRGWHGQLVVEVAGSERQLESVLGATPGEYSAVAAVTTTADGTAVPGAPVHVFVNPTVFERLGPQGSRLVLGHEATHVATDATFTSMPAWLLEGFADFVALAHSDVPVTTAAAQILRRVRERGTPAHLPTPAELDPSAQGLGATYEEAWTVCRYLGRTFGERAMVAFYEAVDNGSSTRQAFRRVLGTRRSDFVRGWRTDLAGLAAGRSGF